MIHVHRQRIEAGGADQLSSLKSAASDRWLRLSPEILFELSTADHASAFVHDTRPKHLALEHKMALVSAQITKRVTLHGLRHTMATIMASDGTPIKVLQGVLGHSTYKLTADLYADHLRDVDISASGLSLLSSRMLTPDF
mgnify:CR=1 FL=1